MVFKIFSAGAADVDTIAISADHCNGEQNCVVTIQVFSTALRSSRVSILAV